MRVLVIAGFAESLLNFRGPLLSAMIARGLEVHVAAPNLFEDFCIRKKLELLSLNLHDICLYRASTNPLTDLKLLCSLTLLIRKIQPDFVLSYTIKPVIYGTIASWLVGVPRRCTLITGLGYAFTGNAGGVRGLVKIVVQSLYKLALFRSHKVFFQNNDDYDLFRTLGLITNRTSTVVVNGSGVDLEFFSVAPLPLGPPHFLMIARLLGDKGVREYAQAAQQLKAKWPDIEFSLVGWLDQNPDSISQSELDSWIQSSSLNYLGRLQDIRPAMRQCSVYVLPSYREGMPRTVLEAMAMGRAVITTHAPGCRETVVEGENGFLVPIKSIDVLVSAMERFIYEPQLAHRMGRRGRELAEERFDVNKINDVMLTNMGL
ncbi:putative alpha-galactosyltransferase [Synechococcus sp. BIOS-E4-1]|uniref:glycosyltransferase family 4 protein n=1 Tax=Synechococcus sp. BIOS-E4-1 TaxID=1400864 RepID=UPI001646C847|nr:glycosyltransferase family 4 protein [Synechococcus sp. BIOS-E4-1]QNI52882.1 putative alpha-galactosyltransferase [Synechococcus sp. BIOS-E4-1]